MCEIEAISKFEALREKLSPYGMVPGIDKDTECLIVTARHEVYDFDILEEIEKFTKGVEAGYKLAKNEQLESTNCGFVIK